MKELDELEDVITNMFMANDENQLNKFSIIAITLILKIKEILREGVKL